MNSAEAGREFLIITIDHLITPQATQIIAVHGDFNSTTHKTRDLVINLCLLQELWFFVRRNSLSPCRQAPIFTHNFHLSVHQIFFQTQITFGIELYTIFCDTNNWTESKTLNRWGCKNLVNSYALCVSKPKLSSCVRCLSLGTSNLNHLTTHTRLSVPPRQKMFK